MFTPTVPSLLEELHLSRILNSSHGVLCFYGHYHRKKDYSYVTYNMTLLWNPSVRKSTAVVVPKTNFVGTKFSSVIGFGVCPATCDPMLVKVTYSGIRLDAKEISCIPYQVMVFTLSSREWKTPCSNVRRKSIGFTWSSAVIGQFIYWSAYDRIDHRSIIRKLQYRNLIMSFDMVSYEFIEVDLPNSLAYLPVYVGPLPELPLSISKLRESLVVLDYTIDTTNHQVCGVWMMEDGDPKSFTKLFTIKSPDARIKRTLGFSKSGEPIIEKQNAFGGGDYSEATLAVYEPCTSHIKDLDICSTESYVFYTESLVLLHQQDDCIYKHNAASLWV